MVNAASLFCLVVLLSGAVLCEEFVAYRAFAEAFQLSPAQLREAVNAVQSVSSRTIAQECTPIGLPPDTDDISKLRPGNVRVIGAIGDSIIAGMSIKDTSITNLRDYRGLSFAIGGDKNAITLGNLMQQFTAPLVGLSTGIGPRATNTTGFNGAVSGAIAQDMLLQAIWLVEQMQLKLTQSEFQNYWKVVTIWIGSNNLCELCNDKTKHAADAFAIAVEESINYLQQNSPRTFVNLVSNLDVTQIWDFKEGTCAFLHPIECPCGASNNAATRASVRAETALYIEKLYAIQDKFPPTKNFAVVVQPFLEQAILPSRSWLAPADCFHPSQIAHEAMSVGLWNNMITPKASKSKKLTPGEQLICPTANTFITLA